MKYMYALAIVIAVAVGSMLISGCSGLIQVNTRAMMIEDIIAMTDAGVGEDVIIRQIQATHSKFSLTSEEIIMLKDAGVNDTVLEAMIESGQRADRFDWEYGYASSYYNSWYPSYTYRPYRSYPYSSPYYAYPYTVYRQSGLVGRFYRYSPDRCVGFE